MEYTKDIILEISCKREIGLSKLKNWTSKVRKGVKNNKIIIMTLSVLSTLMVIDVALVNSFLQLLTKLY